MRRGPFFGSARASLAALVVVVCGASLSFAQRSAALELAAELDTLSPASERWLVASLELVEAQLDFDVRAALHTADELVDATRASPTPGAHAAAIALHELALATLEGPRAIDRTKPSVEPPSADAPPRLRAHYHVARSRRLWLEDAPIDVLSNALAALTASREAGDPVLRLRCAWVVHAITESEARSYDEELFREIEEFSSAPVAARFEPWRLLNAYWRSYSGRTLDERLAIVDAAARAAEQVGELRTLCMAEWERAVLAAEAGEFERAFACLEDARTTSERSGRLRELATSLEIAANLALDQGELDRCEEFLARAERAVDGRGLPDKEVNLAHTRFRLASLRKDEPRIVALSTVLENLRRAEADRHRGYAPVREQLLASERRRLEFEDELAAAREREARTLGTVRRVVGIGAVVALAVVVVLSLRSRRKLKAANELLQAEIRRTESEAEARRALEQRMRLLERTESLGLVASGIAHDFNNLMTGVLGNAELLRLAESDPGRRRRLDAIASAGERGARLCRQLQTYSGDEPLALEPLDLGRLLGELAPVLDAAAGAEIELTVEPATEELVLACNRTQLEQAVLNLVTNARDARAKHVRVRVVRVAMTEVAWKAEFFRGDARDGEFARIEVEDDGEGMDRALIERIFDPFFTTRFPGRGLGLAVAFGALRRHRGLVTVSSRPGAGSRFRLCLPLNGHVASDVVLTPQCPPTAEPPHAVPPMRVLVVDDEADVREYVRAALQTRGHAVAVTGDGAAARETLHTLGDDARTVALVDLSMPVVDGRDVVRALRANGREPAIVLMSGHAAGHLVETARELAVDGHLAKPFTAAELERTLARAVEARMNAPRRSPTL
ncbi:MAG: response regulator [Planctomycetes bacterium]|nr:response regulator [Planctomycetota bacterium]